MSEHGEPPEGETSPDALALDVPSPDAPSPTSTARAPEDDSQLSALAARVRDLEEEVAVVRAIVAGLRTRDAERGSQQGPGAMPAYGLPTSGHEGTVVGSGERAPPQYPAPDRLHPHSAYPPQREPADQGHASATSISSLSFAERGLALVGVGLLLVGIGLLVKYSLDQNWLGPVQRVIGGYATGLALLGGGAFVRRGRSVLGEILMGGGIGAIYLVTFGATNLYELLSFGAAMGVLSGTNVAAFVLARRFDSPLLASLGTLGAYMAPLILATSSTDIVGYGVYVIIVNVGVAAMRAQRDSTALAWTASVGVWIGTIGVVMGLGLSSASPLPFARLVAGLTVASAWLCLSIAPPIVYGIRGLQLPRGVRFVAAATSVLSVGAIEFAVGNASTTTWILLMSATSGIAVALGWLMRSRSVAARGVLWSCAQLILAFSALLIFDHENSEYALAQIAICAIIGHVVTWRFRVVEMRNSSVFLTSISLLMVLSHFGVGVRYEALPFLGQFVWVDFFVLAAVVSGVLDRDNIWSRAVHIVVAHVLFLALVSREFALLENGHVATTAVWATLGAAWLVAGVRFDQAPARWLGFATLGCTIAKLLMVDLAQVAAIWRIVVFLGCGAGFVALGLSLSRLAGRGSVNEPKVSDGEAQVAEDE